MKINLTEVLITFKKPEGKVHENLRAYATITLKDKDHEYLVISGIIVWKSKEFDGLNVEPPKNKSFKYCYGSLWIKFKKEILEQYDYWDISTRKAPL